MKSSKYCSNIVTFDVSVVGIDASSSASKAVSTEYFDLSGRKVAAPATGLYIQKVTFCLSVN